MRRYVVYMKRFRIQCLERRLPLSGEPRNCRRVQSRQPFRCRADGVDENEAFDSVPILRGREHRDSTAPRVAEDIPAIDSQRLPYRYGISGIVFDARTSRAWWLLRFSAATLIEEVQLPLRRERSKRRPQDVVTEVQAAVDAQQRKNARDFGAPEHREREAPTLKSHLLERRRFPLPLAKGEKTLARRAWMWGAHFRLVSASADRGENVDSAPIRHGGIETVDEADVLLV